MRRPTHQTLDSLNAENAIGHAAVRLTVEFSAEIIVVLAVQSGHDGPNVLSTAVDCGRTPELVANAVRALREIAAELEREWQP